MSYFTPENDPKIDFTKVDKAALARLEIARGKAGVPFVITSNYRTPEHSEEVGGFKDDAHTKNPCSAFDIACVDGNSRFRIVQALLAAGFNRIGINTKNNHVHVDADVTKPMNVLFIE